MNYIEKIKKLIEIDKTSLNPKGAVAGKLGVHENYIDMILKGTCDPGPKIKRVLDRMEIKENE